MPQLASARIALESALVNLDKIGASVCAAYVQHALDLLPKQIVNLQYWTDDSSPEAKFAQDRNPVNAPEQLKISSACEETAAQKS